MPADDKRTVRIVVQGRVQGVGFRAFVVREAARLRLEGWVRNRRDGSVEAVAAGPDRSIAEFEASLRRGPSLARVDHFDRRAADDAALLENGSRDNFVIASDG
jgi:acylphosphatase